MDMNTLIITKPRRPYLWHVIHSPVTSWHSDRKDSLPYFVYKQIQCPFFFPNVAATKTKYFNR